MPNCRGVVGFADTQAYVRHPLHQMPAVTQPKIGFPTLKCQLCTIKPLHGQPALRAYKTTSQRSENVSKAEGVSMTITMRPVPLIQTGSKA